MLGDKATITRNNVQRNEMLLKDRIIWSKHVVLIRYINKSNGNRHSQSNYEQITVFNVELCLMFRPHVGAVKKSYFIKILKKLCTKN
jgi:hypothetical protein